MGFFPLKRIRSTTDKTVVSLSISRSLLRLSGKIPALITATGPKITVTIRPATCFLSPVGLVLRYHIKRHAPFYGDAPLFPLFEHSNRRETGNKMADKEGLTQGLQGLTVVRDLPTLYAGLDILKLVFPGLFHRGENSTNTRASFRTEEKALLLSSRGNGIFQAGFLRGASESRVDELRGRFQRVEPLLYPDFLGERE